MIVIGYSVKAEPGKYYSPCGEVVKAGEASYFSERGEVEKACDRKGIDHKNIVKSLRIQRELKRSDICSVETRSVGGGEWSLEILDESGTLLKEFVGSNGTFNDSDDLWEEYDLWRNSLPE